MKSTDYTKEAQAILRFCKRKGMTDSDICLAGRLNQSTVTRVRHGYNKTRWLTLAKLKMAFNA